CTRLPTYLAAGLLKLPVGRFLGASALACAAWVALLFALTYRVGPKGLLVASAAAVGLVVWRFVPHWEFWPAWLFYIPVAVKYLALSIKYRSLSLPSLANPGMHTGGLIGESKFETLEDLEHACPESVAKTRLVRFESVEQQLAELRRMHLEFPIVFKPDV